MEAGARSGSLISARLALEQGREVFAVPGAVINPLAHGTHQFLREGARLVADANGVVEELAPQLGLVPELRESAKSTSGERLVKVGPRGARGPLSAVARRVLCELNSQSSSAEMLLDGGSQGIREVTSALEELALNGLVSKQPDEHWCVG